MSLPTPTPAQRPLLDTLKRLGTATVPELASRLGLNPETVREHLKGLEGAGWAERVGTRSRGRGRPEVVYGPASASEGLYPRREGEMLRGLAEHLSATGQGAVLTAFLEEYVEARREKALARLEGLEGRARLDAAARILSEDGFMAEVREGVDGPELALCHCPVRELVHATPVPCRLEVGYVRDLVGGRPLRRTAHLPSGDAVCSYAVGPAPVASDERS